MISYRRQLRELIGEEEFENMPQGQIESYCDYMDAMDAIGDSLFSYHRASVSLYRPPRIKNSDSSNPE